MFGNLARDLTQKGPVAWLDYFDKSPDFFMASDGRKAFNNYAEAKSFIENDLTKMIRKISLRFDSLRIDSFENRYASVGAGFHEDLTDSSGKIITVNGYFTSIVAGTPDGWKIRNLHWSLIHPN